MPAVANHRVCQIALMVVFAVLYCTDVVAQYMHTTNYDRNDNGRSAWREEAARFNVEALTLYALALVESRRMWSDGLVRPWPWTLHTAAEKDMYFPTYDSALAKLRQILARGDTNVDIGLMQINWRANAYRLPNPAELLDPRNNLQIGAQVLREAFDRCGGDWFCAVARYHSPRSDLGSQYAVSVQKVVERLRHVPDVLEVLGR